MKILKLLTFLTKSGPHGPISALWAHMGLKKFLTQAQLCNFLISAMGCIGVDGYLSMGAPVDASKQ